MKPEMLDQFEKCYQQWNGTNTMEAAFRELLNEVKALRARLQVNCLHQGRTHDAQGWLPRNTLPTSPIEKEKA